MRTLDYNRALSQTMEAQSLSDKILDARLSLTRLRQQSSSSRLTIPTATALLDTQAQQLQELDISLQDLQKKLSGVKEKVKEESRDVERLRVERGEVERTMREKERNGMSEEDGRLVPLYDW
jgi:chromosome segregation ATPase